MELFGVSLHNCLFFTSLFLFPLNPQYKYSTRRLEINCISTLELTSQMQRLHPFTNWCIGLFLVCTAASMLRQRMGTEEEEDMVCLSSSIQWGYVRSST